MPLRPPLQAHAPVSPEEDDGRPRSDTAPAAAPADEEPSTSLGGSDALSAAAGATALLSPSRRARSLGREKAPSHAVFALDTGGSSATPVRLESPGSLQLAQDDEHPLGDILSGQFSQLLSPLQTEQQQQQQQQQQQASPLQSQQQQSHPHHDVWLQLHAGDVLN